MISADGLEFIKQAEGCKLASYQDSVGVWTIGYGHTKGVHGGMTCTQEQADEWLAEDLETVYGDIREYVDVPLTQGQFDALCSWIFNLGAGAFRDSTFRRLLNARDYEGAAEQIKRWVHAGNQVLPGLVKRRAAEAEMFTETA